MSDPIKLFFLFSGGQIGGAERSMMRLAGALGEDFELCFVVVGKDGDLQKALKQQAFEVVALPFERKRDKLTLTARFMKLVAQRKPDLLYVFGMRAAYLAGLWGGLPSGLAGGFVGPKYVATQRYALTDKRWHVLQRILVSGTRGAVISNSRCAGKQLEDIAGIDKERVHVIYNGLTLDKLDADFAAIKATSTPWEGGPHFLTVANLHIRKGHVDLMKALKDILNVHPGAHCHLAGRDDMNGDLHRMVESDPVLKAHVTLHGFCQVMPLLAKTDLVVHPSHGEGLPTALLEALACKVPVVATDVGGTGELIVDDRTGRLVPPHQPQALAQAVLDCLADPKSCERYVKNGREHVLANFTLDRMVSEHARVFRSLA